MVWYGRRHDAVIMTSGEDVCTRLLVVLAHVSMNIHAVLMSSFWRQCESLVKAAGLVAVFLTAGCAQRSKPSGTNQFDRPNILLITLDTTRADHLGCYGYERTTSPHLDRLAAEAVVYTRAVATASSTLPSHAALFTGKFTSSHGARNDPNGPLRLSDALEEKFDAWRARPLALEEVTLPIILQRLGYRTGGVVAGPWLKTIFGWTKGFDFYDDTQIGSVNGRLGDSVTDSALQWIEEKPHEPFFLFLNYFDPHWPYQPPWKDVEQFLPKSVSRSDFSYDLDKLSKVLPRDQFLEVMNALYDGEILFMDRHLGRLIERLKKLRLYDNTWIIVTADHGELLGEHDEFGHFDRLYQEEILIPLIMKYPGGDGPVGRDEKWIQPIDILPEICAKLGRGLPPHVQGNAPDDIQHPIVSETYPYLSSKGDWCTLIEGNMKLHWNSLGNHRLFNLNSDPRELNNLFRKNGKTTSEMISRLTQYLASLPEPGAAPPEQTVEQETLDALKSMGYIK